MNAIQSYQFEDVPVRVVMVADDPWFIANDLAKALGYGATAAMTRYLDDDEKGVHIVDTLGGDQEHTIISESGMYAAVLKSRRAEARRFRRWVTGDVLPSIRKTGKFTLPGHEPPSLPSDFDAPRLIACVTVVREARRLFGPASARLVWVELGLPVCVVDAEVTDYGDPLARELSAWLEGREAVTANEAALGLGIAAPVDKGTKARIGRLLRLMGWQVYSERRADKVWKVWRRDGREG